MEMDENRSSRSREDMQRKDKDRLSHLLEPLLHHILSFMEMKEVVHSSLISKRWRYLWTSVRDLKFDSRLWSFEFDDDDGYVVAIDKYAYFIDTALFLRDGSDIHSFNLDFEYVDVDVDTRFERWIAYALRRHVQLLDFNCVDIRSARSLCLCGHVHTLNISGGFLQHDLNNELVLDLPVVENLSIDNCYTGILLKISGPKLKFLKLLHCQPKYNHKTTVKICAPNLLELIFRGFMYRDYVLENLSTLVTAEVATRPYFWSNASNVTHKMLPAKCVSNILKGIFNVRSLILSAHAFRACALKNVPIIHQKLDYLKLIQWCDSYNVGSIAKLSESFPSLETLVFQKDKIPYERDDKDKEDDNDLAAGLSSKPSMFSHLKLIEVHKFEGNATELEILEFLLSTAPVLEKVTIRSIVASSDEEKQLVRFSEEIQSLQKASPSVSISLNLKRGESDHQTHRCCIE